MARGETILIHSSPCTGCRASEAACGFHSAGEMDPSRSCIQVEKEESTGKSVIAISEGCDVCPSEETPFCIQVCQPRALTLGRKTTASTPSERRLRKGGK